MSESQASSQSRSVRQWVIGIAGTLILGALGSGVWDLLFKPGIGRFGRWCLSLMTLGSESLRDAVYESAALDPTPLPSMMLLIVGVSLPLGVALAGVGSYWRLRDIKDGRLDKAINDAGEEGKDKTTAAESSVGHTEPKQEEQINEETRATFARTRRAIVSLLSVLILLSLPMIIGAIAVNQSILIWRAFHADLSICRPFLSDQEMYRFQARFASIKTRADYRAIASDLRSVAGAHGVRLTEIELW